MAIDHDLQIRGPDAVLVGIFQAWRRRDKAATLAFFAADAVYQMMLPTDVVPFGGETRGKASISDRLQTILDVFDTVRSDLVPGYGDGDCAHGTVSFCFRHRLTGEEIEGSMRQVIRVRDGLVVEFQEFHDLEKVRAFMRLVAYSAAR